MNLEYKPSGIWWTKNPRYLIYFLRELTGVLIVFYIIYFLTTAVLNPSLTFMASVTFLVISRIGLVAAIFHSVTWFWVTVKISPVELNKPLQLLGFLFLLAAWGGVSYILFNFFYALRL